MSGYHVPKVSALCSSLPSLRGDLPTLGDSTQAAQHLHLFPYRAILVQISSRLSVAPCFLLIALLMSGRFLGVNLMDTHHFNVFQWNLFDELRGVLAQSCAIGQLNVLSKASALNSLSNLVPFLILFIELLMSLIPQVPHFGEFPYHLPFCWKLFSNSSTTILILCLRMVEVKWLKVWGRSARLSLGPDLQSVIWSFQSQAVKQTELSYLLRWELTELRDLKVSIKINIILLYFQALEIPPKVF